MLSDSDLAEIRSVANNQLHRAIGTNYSIDLEHLPEAISKAIAEAIRQYDLLSRP